MAGVKKGHHGQAQDTCVRGGEDATCMRQKEEWNAARGLGGV